MCGDRATNVTNAVRDAKGSIPQSGGTPREAITYSASRAVAQCAAIVLILFIYSWPSIMGLADFGVTTLPPIFAPDLSLYLNLASIKTVSPGQVLNPYYLVPVPANGTASLKIRTAPFLFSAWNKLLVGRRELAMFTWNLFWWGLLCAVTLWLFERFLPTDSRQIAIAGLGLLMLFNIGMVKTLLAAWIHLPSLAAFHDVALPFMRAFSPQIPMPLLLGYLGLQMGALRGKSPYRWVGMGVLQLLALSIFPYATLVMAGLTFVSVSWTLLTPKRRNVLRLALVYGAACAITDAVFLKRGSMNIYASHSSLIRFQPEVLPHLIGGAWLILCLLTLAAALSQTLPAEVKFPLVGLGATTLVLMLGDALVPTTVLLLSVHAAYFAHTSAAIIFTFLASPVVVSIGDRHTGPPRVRLAVMIVLVVLVLNGIFLSVETYRAFLPFNRDQVEAARLLSSLPPAPGDLVIARSLSADDACGWVALLSRGPVLFCTDAETMLTPQQNRDIHRLRQAIYLYLSGQNSADLQRTLSGPNPNPLMYRLGFWAEATSLSREEQMGGLLDIQEGLMPLLERIERRDPDGSKFFRQFPRIIVIDDLQNPTFVPAQIGSFLKLAGEKRLDHWVVRRYTPF